MRRRTQSIQLKFIATVQVPYTGIPVAPHKQPSAPFYGTPKNAAAIYTPRAEKNQPLHQTG